ncbi:MAG: glycosyltransferase [Candidatus Sumerlaeia bacterium]|nr:glycosyltransferase [Candidatus Sumerlaeia bacterium]
MQRTALAGVRISDTQPRAEGDNKFHAEASHYESNLHVPILRPPNTPSQTPDVSIILINWRMSEDLASCLACIEKHHHECLSETIVVNKPSGDGTEEIIAEKFPWVRLVSLPVFGFAPMRNEGIRHARARYYLVLDTDTEILPHCFDQLVAFMDRHESIGGCGGHTTRLDGQLEYNVKRFYDLPTVIARRTPLDRLWPSNPWNTRHQMMDKDHSRPFYGDWMAGACFCMRREAVNQVGYFDESMHYFEDVDWCWRAKRAGWKIAFHPGARIIHKVQGLSKKGFNRNTLIHLKSGIRFWWKLHHQGLNWSSPSRPVPPKDLDRKTARSNSSHSSVDLSVIIVNYNARALLLDCLDSLPTATTNHHMETIVVDNDSQDGSVEAAGEWVPPDQFSAPEIIANMGNLGFTKANNQGIARSSGRYVVLLNNDTVVHPDAFGQAIEYLDKHPDIGAAGLRLLNRDGSLQLSCRRFPSFSQALFNRYSILTRLFPNNRFSREYLMTDMEHNEVRDVDWVSGACLLIRREVLDQVGDLDERFFMYSEDVDFCYRVWEAGWRVTYLPFAEVTHLIGQSSRRARVLTIIERHKSMYRFYKKHYSRNLMFLDTMTGLFIGMRCLGHLAMSRLPRFGGARA